MDRDDQRAQELGLEEDELAFYDAVSANLESVYENEFLRDLIHSVVESIERKVTSPAHMDRLLVNWQHHRQVLNRLPVRREKWSY